MVAVSCVLTSVSTFQRTEGILVPSKPSPSGFENWAAARSPSLHRFAYLLTHDADSAPDLVQVALERLLTRWSRMPSAEVAEAYARRCIVNQSISDWRKNRRVVVTSDLSNLDRHDPLAARAQANFDDRQAAWSMLSTLPPQQKAAVILRFYEDLPFDSIAEILDCPPSTARSHVHRAVMALRKSFNHQEMDS